MIRLFYWIRGAPEDRIGGPWWVRDFRREDDLNRFLRDVGPFLVSAKRQTGVPPHVYPPIGDIYPPEDAQEVDLAPFVHKLR